MRTKYIKDIYDSPLELALHRIAELLKDPEIVSMEIYTSSDDFINLDPDYIRIVTRAYDF